MLFALLTLLSALSLAAVAGWFSIIGIMSIFAGAVVPALIMGVVLECGKLVTTSWLYRNWQYASWKLKGPLIIFTLILMLCTSIGVFGFLSKAHLEQGSSTIDNSAKIERLDQQIAREKSTIDDDQKVIVQLDATINSYIGKDRTDRSVAVRRSQEPQRKQLRNDIEESQKRIDQYSDEKFKLQSEVRKLQLDVGPIRYIAELIYGTENSDKNIESAVRFFILIIVSTLDPLAVVLLIAANHTILRLKNKEPEVKESIQSITKDEEEKNSEANQISETPASLLSDGQAESQLEETFADEEAIQATDETKIPFSPEKISSEEMIISKPKVKIPTTVISPSPTQVVNKPAPWAHQSDLLRELLGTGFKNEEKVITESAINTEKQDISRESNQDPSITATNITPEIRTNRESDILVNKYPRAHSWLKEFKR